ncbi:MAG TPA: hypothetical protein VF855_08785 [Acidimicrobiales bacterium]
MSEERPYGAGDEVGAGSDNEPGWNEAGFAPVVRRPGFFSRLFVVAFAFCLGAVASSLILTGEVVGIILGIITALLAIALALVASGIVEWVAARRRLRSGEPAQDEARGGP